VMKREVDEIVPCAKYSTTVPRYRVDDLRRKLIFNRLPKCSSDLFFQTDLFPRS
jgi:hypothetical protein